jgi:hypothetical protein
LCCSQLGLCYQCRDFMIGYWVARPGKTHKKESDRLGSECVPTPLSLAAGYASIGQSPELTLSGNCLTVNLRPIPDNAPGGASAKSGSRPNADVLA